MIKKLSLLTLLPILVLSTGCSNPATTIRICASQLPHAKILQEIVAPIVQEKGFSLNEKISPKDAVFCVKNFEFNVLGTQGLDKAQVTAGGVSISEIDTKTMQSKKAEGLYFCGEILDIDGLCGGFNLHFAWSSAIAASEDIIRRK
jgi:predicted flavoprotein YhiN